MMHTEIDRLWHEIETKRMNLMLRLSKYDNHVLNKKPRADAWSVNQVMQHLMGSESYSYNYLEKKLSFGVNIPRAGFKSQLRYWGLKLAFMLPFKYKAPTFIETFPEFTEFDTLKNDWASNRLAMEQLLKKLPIKVLESEVWKHAVAGKMNIEQMLGFFNDHFDRHLKQIDKTLEVVKG